MNGSLFVPTSRADFGAFELLHELIHELTDSGDLAGPNDSNLNGGGQEFNNSWVYDNCYKP